jgi:hypothetical protein
MLTCHKHAGLIGISRERSRIGMTIIKTMSPSSSTVEAARFGAGSQLRAYCPIAFNDYVRWFISNTHVEMCPPAYDDEILEAPISYDDVAENTYNTLVQQGS